MIIPTNELTGLALDWAVATVEGYELTTDGVSALVKRGRELLALGPCTMGQGIPCGYSPSTYWDQGGPLIDRDKICLSFHEHNPSHTVSSPDHWFASKRHFGRHHQAGRSYALGDTALIAAMRCFVAIALGPEVDVPDGAYKAKWPGPLDIS